MPTASEAQGAHGRLQISTSTTFGSGSSIWLEFLSETITKTTEKVNSAGIRGTRTHCSERTRDGSTRVSGQITFECSRILMDNILPGVLGANESANVFAPAETIPDVYFLIDKRTDIVRINEAKLGRMTIEGSQGQTVRVTIDIEAESITVGQSWPSDNYPERSMPYLFSDLGDVTIEGESREPAEFGVTVDNVLDGDTFLNSRTRDETITATDRIVTTYCTLLAETANADLDTCAVAGAAVSYVLTHADEASSVLTIALGRVAWNDAIPTIDGKGTKLLRLEGQARGLKHPGETSDVEDILITNAHA